VNFTPIFHFEIPNRNDIFPTDYILNFYLFPKLQKCLRLAIKMDETHIDIATNVKCMQRPQIFSVALRIANLGMWHTQCYVSAHFIISALFFGVLEINKSSGYNLSEKYHFCSEFQSGK